MRHALADLEGGLKKVTNHNKRTEEMKSEMEKQRRRSFDKVIFRPLKDWNENLIYY